MTGLHVAVALVIALYVYGSILTVFSIGKPRQPITHGQAVYVLVINAGIVSTLLWALSSGR